MRRRRWSFRVWPARRPNALAIAPDGTWLASATASSDRTVEIWDVATGVPRRTLSGHADIRIWTADSDSACALTRLEQAAHSCVWDSSGRSLAVAGAGGLYRFTLRTSAPARPM